MQRKLVRTNTHNDPSLDPTGYGATKIARVELRRLTDLRLRCFPIAEVVSE